SGDKLPLLVWFILPYLFFSFVVTKMPGYVMIGAPPVFMILSWAFWDIKKRIQEFKYRKLVILTLALFILLPVRYSIERVKPFENKDRNPAWAQELRKIGSRIGAERAVVFNVEHNIEAMFYAKISAYPFIPDQKQIDQAVGRGFKVFIYDDSRIPPEIRNSPRVVVLSHEL
ncbi:MAG TPA: hypothetical protein VJ044_07745, partial [Candidatus Hodarchaeales archaeon]|nr:hypothetical protein [Candidatus Hodarchaeales archaeon]